MPFDGVAMRATAAEIADKILGGRVEKVLQPERDELHLVIRNQYQNYRLLLSASANNARVHLTTLTKPNPDRAPLFCMLLRKHLIGGKVLGVSQQGLERVLDLTFGVLDELGIASELTLHVEVMGRHSNIVLTDTQGTILDCIKRVTEEKSRVREVLPGLRYEAPPAQGKQNPLELDAAALGVVLASSVDHPLLQTVCDRLSGLAQPTARELLTAAGLDPACNADQYTPEGLNQAAQQLAERFAALREYRTQPTVLLQDGAVVDFLPFASVLATEQRPCASLCEAAEAFFGDRDRRERLKQSSAGMVQVLNTALARARKKLEKQLASFDDSANLEQYRLMGELLTANLHALRRGEKEAEVVNYYDPDGGMLRIPLDPMLTPSDNAQRYYKRYAKAKSAQENLKEQLAATHAEIDYLESQLSTIALSTTQSELDEIRLELVDQGYLKDNAPRGKKRAAPSRPYLYRSSDGYDIWVGRNNTQNDALTLKFARNDDLWLHTKEIPGSHVIVRAHGGAVSDEALRAGALLAAYYSRARGSSGVPVDYTQRRNVKKPSGARPGFVIYLTNRTMQVTPDEAAVAQLTRVE